METRDIIGRVCGGMPFTMEEAHEVRDLAQLGARVLEAIKRETMRSDGSIDDNGEGAYRLKDAVIVAAHSLGLLEGEVKP